MARHIEKFTIFLDEFHLGLSDVDLNNRLTRTAILLRNPPYQETAAQPTQSRHNLAQKCLLTIRREFGDSVYYLCLFASTVTTLSTERKQLGDALAQWSGKDRIPSAFTKQAQALVEKYHAEKRLEEERRSHTSPRKRPQSTPYTTKQSSANDSGNTYKRARLHEGSRSFMSVGRIIVQSRESEGENDTLHSREERPDNEFNVSYQHPLDVRNECSMSYQGLFTNRRNSVASQLAAGNEAIVATGREVDLGHRPSGDALVESGDSDDSDDDEEDPTISAPVNSVNPVHAPKPVSPASPVYPFHPVHAQDGMVPTPLLLTIKCSRFLFR
ncbi:hypothetical protein CDEST_09246 [Colletotrichum destructivum]|uniref:Uncharacterized protein n=1 Tax=Colletotrichum destructivum TaxID=34406 RepID=A0AAX4IM21_9PEZI|nr:hypothetical protein CDEST_09246 [Colletotrichum destructivum]